MKEFGLRYQMYAYIASVWVLGDIMPLIVRTMCATIREDMSLRNPNVCLPQHMTSLNVKTLIVVVPDVKTSDNSRMVNSSHMRIV